jgi:hypothetical protein
MARSRRPHPPTEARPASRTPPSAPVPWRVVTVRKQPVEAPPIFAKSWFMAREAAMTRYGVGPDEVELEMIESSLP